MNPTSPPELPPLHLRVRVPESVLIRQVGDELVMLHIDREKYYGLNEVGARVMQLAEEGATLGEIARRVEMEFEVEATRAEQDVGLLAAELLAAGLMEVAQEP